MQLFFGMIVGSLICLLAFKHKFSSNCGHFKVCKNYCPFYAKAVDIIRSELVKDEVLKNCDTEEVNNE